MPTYGTETHLFSSHPAIDATDASARRVLCARRPASPEDPKIALKASHKIQDQPVSKAKSSEIDKFERKKTGARAGA